ncbi:MAG: MMPL family transporter [Clostridium sp.]|nr:MMPL family transporter [Clostridium sp.]
MYQLGKGIVKCRYFIFALSLLLLIPAGIGYVNTRVNYDILSYLPGDIETMEGQDILVEDFGTGAFSICVLEGMSPREVSILEEKMEAVEHVKNVIWYDDAADISIPISILPDSVREVFYDEDADCTMMAILFDTTMSADETMDAIEEIREIADERCFISGMSAVVTDIKNLSDKEVPVYVVIAVILALIVLSLTMDSFLIPLFFLLSIGMAIVYNLGTNVFWGEISYVTKALSAVLQLGVTMDYSIFLWHSYKAEKGKNPSDKYDAMAHAIGNSITSVMGSSLTTVAGFISLCFMSFTLGLDLGVVMAKGVVIGVICCVTILPSMILMFDKALERTSHKQLLPKFTCVSKFVTKHYILLAVLFAVIWIPATIGYTNTDVYYDLAGTLPKELPSIMANEKLADTFEMGSTHIVLVDSDMRAGDMDRMLREIRKTDGVKNVLGLSALLGPTIPKELLPDTLTKEVVNDRYEMMLVSSEYQVATDEINAQCDALTDIVKRYDADGMVIGEAACTKDLISITNHDFQTVSIVSIGVIFLLILIVFKSISLPVVLVAVIEFAIFINMGIPYYTKTTLPFIASIVIGTIQLGATVDYAILMTNKYKDARYGGMDKKEAVFLAHSQSIQSVIVSALSFFAATFGVGVYSNIDMISALCMLMARGALISMAVVLLVLPSMFLIFDGLICRTSAGFRKKKEKSGEAVRELQHS